MQEWLKPLSVEELKKIDDKAQKIHDEVFGELTDNENLEEYLEYQGIDVRYIDSSEIDGYSRWDNEKGCPVIAVSVNGNAKVRQRFTMAHELGHLILDWGWYPGVNQNSSKFVEKVSGREFLNILSYRGNKYTVNEQEVDEFAGAFLIPGDKLKFLISEFLRQNKNKNYNELADKLALEISQTFKVSIATAKLRLKNYLRQITSEQR